MKFTPRLPSSNVNVGKRSPLVDFFVLSAGLAAIVFVVYLVLGLLVEVVVPHVPYELELRIAESIPFQRWDAGQDETELRLQALAEDLAASSEWAPRELHVHVVRDDAINAAALPGGHILVFQGLLDEVESENELAMILAHEVGHLVNRDHLKGLGRRLVLQTISWSLFGSAPGLNGLGDFELGSIDLQFSRRNESRCDAIGLELLVRHYGHAGGATRFFERHMHRDGPRSLEWLRTHPLSEKRIADLRGAIEAAGYPERETLPWP